MSDEFDDLAAIEGEWNGVENVRLISFVFCSCPFFVSADEDGHVKQPLSEEMSTLFIRDGTLISNNEISFKFPIDDQHPICTIDEYIIPPTQPSIGKYIPSSG